MKCGGGGGGGEWRESGEAFSLWLEHWLCHFFAGHVSIIDINSITKEFIQVNDRRRIFFGDF